MTKTWSGGVLAFIALFGCAVAGWAADVPREAMRHFNRGMAAVEMAKTPEDYGAAIDEFRKASELAPKWPDVYYNLGVVQEKAGKLADAVKSLRRYLALAPNAPDAARVAAFADKLEFRAEQTLSDDDVLDILASVLVDRNAWKIRGIQNANLLKLRYWVRHVDRKGRELQIYYPSTYCGAPLLPSSRENFIMEQVMPSGKILEFNSIRCVCAESVQRNMCGVASHYRLEVISRRKVTMWMKARFSAYGSGPSSEEVARYEFVRN